MADYFVATDTPVTRAVTTEKFGKKEYTFPIWPTSAWKPVLSALLARRMESLKRNLKLAGVKPDQAAYYLMQEECRIPGPEDAHNYSMTLEGVDVVLKGSLVGGGVPDDEATIVVAAIPTYDKWKMNVDVAGVFEKRESLVTTTGTGTEANKNLAFGEAGQQVPTEADTFGGSQPAPPNPSASLAAPPG